MDRQIAAFPAVHALKDAAENKAADMEERMFALEAERDQLAAELNELRTYRRHHAQPKGLRGAQCCDPALDGEIDALTEERDKLQRELRELGEQLESDRSQVADCITRANKELASRAWLMEGRGSYGWDDDRYQSEFLAAGQAFKAALEPLAQIAQNWVGCPQTTAEVIKSRVDLKAERDRLAGEVEDAKRCYSILDRSYHALGDKLAEKAERLGKLREIVADLHCEQSPGPLFSAGVAEARALILRNIDSLTKEPEPKPTQENK